MLLKKKVELIIENQVKYREFNLSPNHCKRIFGDMQIYSHCLIFAIVHSLFRAVRIRSTISINHHLIFIGDFNRHEFLLKLYRGDDKRDSGERHEIYSTFEFLINN